MPFWLEQERLLFLPSHPTLRRCREGRCRRYHQVSEASWYCGWFTRWALRRVGEPSTRGLPSVWLGFAFSRDTTAYKGRRGEKAGELWELCLLPIRYCRWRYTHPNARFVTSSDVRPKILLVLAILKQKSLFFGGFHQIEGCMYVMHVCNVCMYVCMYVMCVCIYVCTHVFVFVCMSCIYIYIYVCKVGNACVCTGINGMCACMLLLWCMYVHMYFMYLCMRVSMCAMYVYIFVCACVYLMYACNVCM